MTTPASLTLLSKGFIKTLVPCCSHGGLHVLTKYPASTSKVFADTEISSSPLAPPPNDLGPHTSHHPAEIFSLHKDGTEGSSSMCIIRGKDLTTVHRAYSSDHAISQLRVHVSHAEHSKQQRTPSPRALLMLWNNQMNHCS